MKNPLRASLFLLLIPVLLVQPVWSEDEPAAIRQESPTGIRHSFLVTGGNPAMMFNEDSELIWEAEGYSRDGYVLDNGNILLSTGKEAREYKQDSNKIVWSYTLADINEELGTVFRLENGDTMIVERGNTPRILEIGKDGSINVEVPLLPETDNNHMQTRMARKLPNGNYLVPHLFAFKVKEYTPEGKVVWEIPTDLEMFGGREVHNWPFTAILLPNGNIHANLTHGDKVAEFDPEGNVVWWCDNTQVEGNPFRDPCGGQRLPNNNMVIGSYGQKDADMPKIFEVTRDKQVVWKFFHPDVHAHEIHIITTNGKKVSPVMR